MTNIDLNDKNARLALIGRYLDASTDVWEERALAEYYRTHIADTDEIAVSRLVQADTVAFVEPKHCIFHSIPVWLYAFATAAAMVVGAVFLFRTSSIKSRLPEAIPSAEIVETINELMIVNSSDIRRITAIPQGSNVIVEAEFKDGSVSYYLMSKDFKGGETRLTAYDMNL